MSYQRDTIVDRLQEAANAREHIGDYLVALLREAAEMITSDAPDLRKLWELESGGVDNWSWYDEIDWGYIETGVRSE